MSIFREMWPQRTFPIRRDYTELQRMLGEAIARGHIEEIPVIATMKPGFGEKWFREIETGAIYSLTEPDEKVGPTWRPIDLKDLMKGSETIQ